MKKRTKIAASIISAIILASAVSTTVFAAVPETVEPQTTIHNDYTIKTTTALDGEKKWFDSTASMRIEYNQVKLTSAAANAKGYVTLWQKPWYTGGINMGNRHVFNKGTGNRAYWEGCNPENYLIHLEAGNNILADGTRTPIKTLGVFRNY